CLILSACSTVDCASAEECAAKGDAIPLGFGGGGTYSGPPGGELLAQIDSMTVQLKYYDKACGYNPTGSSCVKAELIRSNVIPQAREAHATVERLKQLEKP